jgi:hypothetical protein
MDISDKSKHSFDSFLIAHSFMRYERNRFLESVRCVINNCMAPAKQCLRFRGSITLFAFFQSIGLLRVTALTVRELRGPTDWDYHVQ